MTVTVERSFKIDAPIETVWDILSDDEKRAGAISVVNDFKREGEEGIWYLKIPVPLVNGTVAVRTRDLHRDPPKHVKFEGTSKIMRVTGEHKLSETDSGCLVENTFVVDGKVPGVERFFKKNFDKEINNIRKNVEASIASVEEL